MTKNHDLKKLIRERQEKTGETYTAARRHVLAAATATPAVPAPDTAPTLTARTRNALIETTDDEARALLERALAAAPRLTHFGIGLYDEPQRRLEARRTGTGEQVDDEFTQQRTELGAHLDEIAACADWIKRQQLTKSFNKKHTSYGYKHFVEKWFGDRGGHMYIANGSFIAAALGLGYEGKPDGVTSPNVWFRFSERTVELPDRAPPLRAKNRYGHPVLEHALFDRVVSFMQTRGWSIGAKRSSRGNVTIPSPMRGEEYDFHDLAFEERLETSTLLGLIGMDTKTKLRVRLSHIAGTFPDVPRDIGGKWGVIRGADLLEGVPLYVVRLDDEDHDRLIDGSWFAVREEIRGSAGPRT